MNMNERRKVIQEVSRLSIDSGTLGSLLKDVQDLISLHGEDTHVCMEQDSEENMYVQVFVQRPETDKELVSRIERHAAYEARMAEIIARSRKRIWFA